MDRSRIVELYSAPSGREKGGFGSGYLLSDGLILTAAHVLGAGTVEARPLDGERWIPVSTVWRNAVLDVALVEGALRADTAAPRFGMLDGNERLAWEAVGFPKVSRRLDGEGAERDTLEVWGTIAPRSMGKSVFDRANLAGDSTPPATEELWRGMSGAGVFAMAPDGERALIGVAVAAPDKLNAKALDYAPLTEIVAAEGFPLDRFDPAEVGFTTVGRGRSGFGANFRYELAGELYHVDHRPQIESAMQAVERCLDPTLSQPIIAFATGVEADEIELLAQRFENDFLPSAIRQGATRTNARMQVRTYDLDWPATARDLHEAGRRLRFSLLRRLSVRGDRSAGDFVTEETIMDEVLDRLRRDRGPSAFYTVIRSADFGEAGVEVLTDWLSFWDGLAARRPTAPLLYLILVEGAAPAESGTWGRVRRLLGRSDPLATFVEQVLRLLCRHQEDTNAPVVLFEDLGELAALDLKFDIIRWIESKTLQMHLRLEKRHSNILAGKLRDAIEAEGGDIPRMADLRRVIHKTDFTETRP